MSDIIVEHGTTSDGLMAARVDGLAYIAIPLKEGFSIVSGWKLNRPIGEWSRSDVYCAEGAVADEVSFRGRRHRKVVHAQRARPRRYNPARFHALGHVSIGDHLR